MKYGYKINNVNETIEDYTREESLKAAAERQKNAIPTSEIDGDGKEKYELGKKAYFDEYYYGIKSEINTSISFKKGYEAAERAVKFNITDVIPKEYLEVNNSVKKK